jgi:hypothetical protein
MHSLVSAAKMMVVRPGRRTRRVKSGAFKGLRMELDLQHESQMWLGIYEREIQGWLRRLSAGIRTGIDIGAAAGEYTLYFLAKTAADVLAFDPDATAREQFHRNLSLYGSEAGPRVRHFTACVGPVARDGLYTLDDFADSLRQPCLVKIDVDGGECDVLAGARRLLREPQTRWLLETHAPELEEKCRAVLEAAGFRTVIISQAWWRWLVPENRPIPHNRWLVGFRDLVQDRVPGERGVLTPR